MLCFGFCFCLYIFLRAELEILHEWIFFHMPVFAGTVFGVLEESVLVLFLVCIVFITSFIYIYIYTSFLMGLSLV